MDEKRVERVKYMTGEMLTTAAAVNGSLTYLKKEITAPELKGCNLLFIHIPSAKYTPGEVGAITKYITSGGSLFLVMDQEMWSTLDQTNVNDLIRPFGIQFGAEGPDSQAGGHTNAGPITEKRLKISYHGARTVTGGTPFAFNDRSDANHSAHSKEVEKGGRVVHGVPVHDQLGRCSGLPVPGVHAGGLPMVAEECCRHRRRLACAGELKNWRPGGNRDESHHMCTRTDRRA